MANQSEKYWASENSQELVTLALDKIDKFYDYLIGSGRMGLYKRSWGYYYNSRLTGASVGSGGSQGEFSTLSVNDFRNLLAHIEAITTQARIAFEPKATNSDMKSQDQVILAGTLLDYYMRDKRLERNFVTAVKQSLIYGEAFIRIDWDATAGEIYGLGPDGKEVNEGDIKYTNYAPNDVIRDFTQNAPGKDKYYILRDFENKYELAAKFPGSVDDILRSSDEMLAMSRTTVVNYLQMQGSDNIPVYTLIHDKTAALPQGRLCKFLENGAVLIDVPLPYSNPNVFRIAPDEEDGTIFGFTVAFDLLPMQQISDMLYSTVSTNQAAFGVQNILVPKGADIGTPQLSGGMKTIPYDPKIGKPEPLNLTDTPAEIFNYMSMVTKGMETLSGINSVVRGNPEASLESGAALALVQSQALQFNQPLMRAYNQLVEDVGMGTVNMLKDFAATKRVAEICGKSNRPKLQEFTGQDLSDISRVLVDMGSPISRTTAGKVQIAETLMKNQLIKTPDQYIQVLTTGKLDPIIEGIQAELLLIKGENEDLANNKPAFATIVDDHVKHIQEHRAVLANPNVRNNDNPVLRLTLDHIAEHVQLMQKPEVQWLATLLHQETSPAPQPQAGQVVDNSQTNAPQPEANLPNMPSPPQGTEPVTADMIEQNKGNNPNV